MTQDEQLQQIFIETKEFRQRFETLLMSTSSYDGLPEASYAGYIEDEGDYYVYTSELAKHTKNLQDNSRCSVLFIENEGEASHLLARKRLSYSCEVSEVSRKSPSFNAILDKLTARFGFVMNNLREMGDFHLFRLRPLSGNFVAGFAKAYTLTGDSLKSVKHRNEGGHRKNTPESKIA